MKNPAKLALTAGRDLAHLPREFEKSLVNQGRILARLNAGLDLDDLADYEFSIFSQWGEDGIIQHLLTRLDGVPRTFIEFGVEDFTESNCRFLMMKDNWRGFIVDGSEANVASIRNQRWHWKHDLTAVCAFIDKDNVNALLDRSGFGREPGILSIDIDGVDWHVLNALEDWRPYILIVEYNGLWGYERPVSVPYDPAFARHSKHFSGLYWGANLRAFQLLAEQRGYLLAGTNAVGSNAFFVRRDKVRPDFRAVPVERACRPVTFRDARDTQGKLLFIPQAERVDMIAQLPLVDTVTGAELRVVDLGLGSAR